MFAEIQIDSNLSNHETHCTDPNTKITKTPRKQHRITKLSMLIQSLSVKQKKFGLLLLKPFTIEITEAFFFSMELCI